jgi:hypothetical protein
MWRFRRRGAPLLTTRLNVYALNLIQYSRGKAEAPEALWIYHVVIFRVVEGFTESSREG